MHRRILEITGNILILAMLFYSGITGSLKHAIFTSLLPVSAYLFVAIKSNKKFYLYCGLILLSLSYSLTVRLVPNPSLWFILSFPLVLIFYVISCRSRKEFSLPLEIVGHLNFYYLVFLAVWMQVNLRPSLISISMFLYAALHLIFARIKKAHYYIFGGAIAFSLSYYFLLNLMPEVVSSKALLFYSVISIIYIGIGFWLSKINPKGSDALYTAAILISFASSFFVLFFPMLPAGSIIILISALSFILLTLITGRNEYLYLVSLAVGVLIFHFLEFSHQIFTTHLVDYFFYALIGLGAIFIFLFFKERLKIAIPFSYFVASGVKGMIMLSLPLMGIIAFIFLFWYPVRTTSNPIFCGSCHNMKPQYEAWKSSAHGEFECGKCHYNPGVKGFVTAKLGGMVDATKYITGKYFSEKFLYHTEVGDSSCIQCHKLDELFDKEVSYKDLTFDHEFHFTGSPAGIDLTCATCHAHIRDENHFEINESVCLTCHTLDIENFELKDIEIRDRICEGCHGAKVEITDEIHNIHIKGQNARCIACHTPK